MTSVSWPSDFAPSPDNYDEPHITVTTEVNGKQIKEVVATRLHVADFLRQQLGLTGTHIGCEQGVCGMCTVLVDGVVVKSCLMLAVQLDGHKVETVESLAPGEDLSPLQQSFSQKHALQCGFCTPGFLMAATGLSRRPGCSSAQQVREELAGVMCRCTGYESIIDAVCQYLDGMEQVPAP